jgi:hypothetical protein
MFKISVMIPRLQSELSCSYGGNNGVKILFQINKKEQFDESEIIIEFTRNSPRGCSCQSRASD